MAMQDLTSGSILMQKCLQFVENAKESGQNVESLKDDLLRISRRLDQELQKLDSILCKKLKKLLAKHKVDNENLENLKTQKYSATNESSSQKIYRNLLSICSKIEKCYHHSQEIITTNPDNFTDFDDIVKKLNTLSLYNDAARKVKTRSGITMSMALKTLTNLEEILEKSEDLKTSIESKSIPKIMNDSFKSDNRSKSFNEPSDITNLGVQNNFAESTQINNNYLLSLNKENSTEKSTINTLLSQNSDKSVNNEFQNQQLPNPMIIANDSSKDAPKNEIFGSISNNLPITKNKNSSPKDSMNPNSIFIKEPNDSTFKYSSKENIEISINNLEPSIKNLDQYKKPSIEQTIQNNTENKVFTHSKLNDKLEENIQQKTNTNFFNFTEKSDKDKEIYKNEEVIDSNQADIQTKFKEKNQTLTIELEKSKHIENLPPETDKIDPLKVTNMTTISSTTFKSNLNTAGKPQSIDFVKNSTSESERNFPGESYESSIKLIMDNYNDNRQKFKNLWILSTKYSKNPDNNQNLENLKKTINLMVNTLSRHSGIDLMKKIRSITDLLNGKEVSDSSGKICLGEDLSAKCHTLLVLTKTLCSQIETIIDVSKEAAFPLAVTIKSLFQSVPNFYEYFIVFILFKYPLFLNRVPDIEKLSKDSQYKMIFSGIDNYETMDSEMLIHSMVKKYESATCLLVISLGIKPSPISSKSENDRYGSLLWKILVNAVVSLNQSPDLAHTIVNTVLYYSGEYLKSIYGVQFDKLMKSIGSNIDTQDICPECTSQNGLVSQMKLKDLCQNYNQKGTFVKPEGYIDDSFWKS